MVLRNQPKYQNKPKTPYGYAQISSRTAGTQSQPTAPFSHKPSRIQPLCRGFIGRFCPWARTQPGACFAGSVSEFLHQGFGETNSPTGAKARILPAAFAARLKSCPFKTSIQSSRRRCDRSPLTCWSWPSPGQESLPASSRPSVPCLPTQRPLRPSPACRLPPRAPGGSR
jgi:hypothetical protein